MGQKTVNRYSVKDKQVCTEAPLLNNPEPTLNLQQCRDAPPAAPSDLGTPQTAEQHVVVVVYHVTIVAIGHGLFK